MANHRPGIVNAVSVSLTVVSILLSVFFYMKAQKRRDPRYVVYEPPAKVFDSKLSAPGLRVVDGEGQPIQDDVHVVTASFWNAGDLPIEPEDVRQTVVFSITPARRILSATIMGQTHPNISAFSVLTLPPTDQSDSRYVQLSWRHLDPGFGVRFQVIYVGAATAHFRFGGNIVGTEGPNDARPRLARSGTTRNIINVLVGLIAGFLSNVVGMALVRKRRRLGRTEWLSWVYSGALVGVVGGVLFVTLRFLMHGVDAPI
ncbi:MAG: hypothetical protein LAO31_23120 [Acidobacteriia bacterium]|nr:hypothetical protein [Terriglobia bacterium]